MAGESAGPVLIAIDELDKMTDPDRMRALLRDVKGIFEVPGVHFLVSLSHEALRSLKLGAIDERNEFNSSFYTVLELPPLSPLDCEGLLWQGGSGRGSGQTTSPAARCGAPSRSYATTETNLAAFFESRAERASQVTRDRKGTAGDSPNAGLALAVVAAGNAREVVRLAEFAVTVERPLGVSPKA